MLLQRRLVAYVLDCGVLLAGLLALQALLYPVNPIVKILRTGQAVDPSELHLWVAATATLPFLIYFALMIASAGQATIGMRWLRLRVTDLRGARVRTGRAILRSAVLLVPFELNHALMFFVGAKDDSGPLLYVGIAAIWLLIAVYLLSAMVSPLGQSIHDRIAGTVVTRAGE